MTPTLIGAVTPLPPFLFLLLLASHFQCLNSCFDALRVAYDETATDYGISASGDDLLHCVRVYPTVELEFGEGSASLLTGRLKGSECLEGTGNEGLPSGSWMNPHNDDEVGEGAYWYEFVWRGFGVDGDSWALSERADAVTVGWDVGEDFGVGDEVGCTGCGECFEEVFGVFDHKVCFDWQVAVHGESGAILRAKGEARDEVAIHNVYLDGAGSTFVDFGAEGGNVAEVSIEHGYRYLDHTASDLLSMSTKWCQDSTIH